MKYCMRVCVWQDDHRILSSTTAKVASLLDSLSPYLPESLHRFLPPQQKTPDTWLASIDAHLRPAYRAILTHLNQLSSLLPPSTSPSPQQPNSVADLVRTAVTHLETLEPTLVAGFILTFILALRLFMSWYSRFPSWSDRLSPFTRSSSNAKNSGEVSDSDFSYITADDLAKHNSGNGTFTPSHNRETDVLILKHKRVSYPVHFPAHSIDKGHLKVGDIRAAAAKKLEIDASDADRIKILYRGKTLKDDGRTAQQEGLTSAGSAELMLVVGDPPPRQNESDDSEGEEDEEESTEVDGASGSKKKKRNRKRKSKKKGGSRGDSGTATPTSSYVNSSMNPDATYAPSAAPPPRPVAAQRPQAPPQTALEKLDALSSLFHTKYVPECVQFLNNPPEDKAKKEFEHKRFSETILAQVLLKLDAVETEGDPAARTRRKELVKEVQNILNRLDELVKA